MPTEDKLWFPPLAPKDQQKLDRLRSKGKQSTSNRTGFADRTLWDWIQFFAVLAIPIIVGVGTLYFTQQITLQQAQLSIAASEKQHQTDIQIANDQQQEATLKTYLDDMSDLLLNHNLRNSKPADAVREVAKERTLIALRRLQANRNRILVQFLQDAHLIGMGNTVIDLSHTDLSGDDLSGANLSGVDLSFSYLDGAKLGFSDLDGAKLYGADLRGADLTAADLYRADLTAADLRGAHLFRTDLSEVFLIGAFVTGGQLSEAKSLRDAIMPDGSTHP